MYKCLIIKHDLHTNIINGHGLQTDIYTCRYIGLDKVHCCLNLFSKTSHHMVDYDVYLAKVVGKTQY